VAVLSRHRYWAKVPVRTWLFGILLDQVRHHATSLFQRRTEKPKLPALHLEQPSQGKILNDEEMWNLKVGVGLRSHWVAVLEGLETARSLALILPMRYGLGPTDVAYLLKISPQQAEKIQTEGQVYIQEHLDTCPTCTAFPQKAEAFTTFFQATLSAPQTGKPPTGEQLEEWRNEILEGIAQHRSRKRRLARSLQALLVGATIVTLFFAGRFSSRLWPGDLTIAEPPTELSRLVFLEEQNAPLWMATPIPATPPPLPETIRKTSSLDGIKQRLRHSRDTWQTLWVDFVVLQYGPPDYSGLPQASSQKQAWFSGSTHTRVVYGSFAGVAEGTYSIVNGRVFWNDFKNHQVFSDLRVNQLTDIDLEKLFMSADFFQQGGEFTIGEEESFSGRPALELSWHKKNENLTYRFLVDEEYGIVLRRQDYWGPYPEKLVEELWVTQIQINPAMPKGIFDPFAFHGDYFMEDASAQARKNMLSSDLSIIPLPVQSDHLQDLPVPEHFDLSKSTLSFRWPDMGAASSRGVRLFADDYYLGTLPIENVPILNCKRSPDGWQIAFRLLNVEPPGSISLYWVDLQDVSKLNPILIGQSVAGDYAFAPDSRRIAYFGCDRPLENCGVSVLDTVSGGKQALLSISFTDYLLWSPDGGSLGFVAAESNPGDGRYLIMRLADGTVTYQGKFDWKRLGPLSDSPASAWVNAYPVPLGGLAGCAYPDIK